MFPRLPRVLRAQKPRPYRGPRPLSECHLHRFNHSRKARRASSRVCAQRAAPTRCSRSRSPRSCTTRAAAARTTTGGRSRTSWSAVETASTGYAAGAVWPTPPAWRGTDQWVVDYTPQRHARARAPACAHAHAGGVSRSPGAMGGPSSARGGGGGARSLGRSRARGVALVMAVGVAVGYTEHHARHARRASRGRTRTSSPLRARHHRLPSPPRTTGTRALRRRRRSLDRAHAVWRNASTICPPHSALSVVS